MSHITRDPYTHAKKWFLVFYALVYTATDLQKRSSVALYTQAKKTNSMFYA